MINFDGIQNGSIERRHPVYTYDITFRLEKDEKRKRRKERRKERVERDHRVGAGDGGEKSEKRSVERKKDIRRLETHGEFRSATVMRGRVSDTCK